jgi:tRNA-binding protein
MLNLTFTLHSSDKNQSNSQGDDCRVGHRLLACRSHAEVCGGAMAEITYAEFEKVDIRVGTIVEVEPYPEARKPAFKLKVDFGPALGIKKTSAQITKHYRLEELVGRQVAAVVNFPPKQIGKFMSEVLVLGFPDAEGGVVLVRPDLAVPNGGKLF